MLLLSAQWRWGIITRKKDNFMPAKKKDGTDREEKSSSLENAYQRTAEPPPQQTHKQLKNLKKQTNSRVIFAFSSSLFIRVHQILGPFILSVYPFTKQSAPSTHTLFRERTKAASAMMMMMDVLAIRRKAGRRRRKKFFLFFASA